jgi:hypothetical protein
VRRLQTGADRYPEFLKIMSDHEQDPPRFRNEETVRRRAWIDRALAGVRDRLQPAELGPAAPVPKSTDSQPEGPAGRPRLYLVKGKDPA